MGPRLLPRRPRLETRPADLAPVEGESAPWIIRTALCTEVRGGVSVILSEVPLATMFDYANELRSMTQGKGSFSMEFFRYKQVPNSLQDEVIARRKADKEERLAVVN